MLQNEFYTMAELAGAVKVPRSTIQHWVSIGVLRPATVAENGYRMFDRMSLVRAKEIKRLREERFTIPEIKEKLG
jgi:DNA-binding transcriptional MerR regulator